MYNVDGSENRSGRITNYCDLLIKQGRKESVQRFYLANLGRDRTILGFPWLCAFNPSIDWTTRSVRGGPITLSITSRRASEAPKTVLRYAQLLGHALQTTGWEEGDSLVLQINRTNIAQEWAIQEHQQKKAPTAADVPKEYSRHWRVFSEKEAQRFPPSREDDHAIKLKPDAPATLDCKVYPLNPQEMIAADAWLKEQ